MLKQLIRARYFLIFSGLFMALIGICLRLLLHSPAAGTLTDLGILILWMGYYVPRLETAKGWQRSCALIGHITALIFILIGGYFTYMSNQVSTLADLGIITIVITWFISEWN